MRFTPLHLHRPALANESESQLATLQHVMENGIGRVGFSFEYLNRFRCRQDQQFDVAALSFCLHFFHHWQSTSAGADHQAAVLPRYLFFQR